MLVVVAAARAVKAAPAVRAAGLVRVFLMVAGVAVGAGAAGLVGLLIWRWHRWQAARAVGQLHGAAVPPLHGAARAAKLPPPAAAIGQHLHHHGRGVSAAGLAAITGRRRQDR